MLNVHALYEVNGTTHGVTIQASKISHQRTPGGIVFIIFPNGDGEIVDATDRGSVGTNNLRDWSVANCWRSFVTNDSKE